MPPPMRYPAKLLIRLPEDWRKRIEALRAPDEQLADTQRRVIKTGIETLETEASQKSLRTPRKQQLAAREEGESDE